MPRKTRILHGDDEYLFVEAPGDALGPALLIFARPENARAVAPGRSATHQTEHGSWVAIARFDGQELALAPEPPAGLGDRLKGMLPKYVGVRMERSAQAKNACWWVALRGSALHALHPAQPAGVLLKLWRNEADARRELESRGASGSVQTTGDLREFLELRAEEGFAGALIDPGLTDEFVFFCLDEASRIQFIKLAPGADDDEATNAILDDAGRWRPYEGDGELDPFVNTEGWDRLMVRTFGRVPFFGYRDGWRCYVLERDGQPVPVADPDGNGASRMVALFHDPAAADDFRSRQKLGRAALAPVSDLPALVRRQAEQGIVARLHPGDHRARGGTLWLRGDELLLDSFSGIWRSRDGHAFEAVAPEEPEEPAEPTERAE